MLDLQDTSPLDNLQRARPDGMPRTRLEVVDDDAAPASAPVGEPHRSDGEA